MATEALDKPKTGEVTSTEPTRSGRRYRPVVDILEKADELTVLADMPGTSGENVDINFENGTLTIHGKVRPRDYEKGEMLLHEYGIGDFYRTFQVSETIDPAKISAEFANGVLTLHLPKVEAVKPRKITVRAS